MKDINIKLEIFEGPLDLLYHLIEKNELNIYDIPIALITDQFMEYTFSTRDMDNISEFLVMASTLLEIKSKMLLPKPKNATETDENIDPREELVRRLLEYKRFKEISEILRNEEVFSEKVIFREENANLIEFLIGEKLHKPEDFLENIPLETMQKVFLDILNRKELKKDKIRFSFNSIKKDSFTIENQILLIKKQFTNKKSIFFRDIFSDSENKIEIVVTFLAVLEMLKLKLINVLQENLFDEIIIIPL